ncbi:hypothetical protein RQN30_05540 [Arcanobacterium hippocoleae]
METMMIPIQLPCGNSTVITPAAMIAISARITHFIIAAITAPVVLFASLRSKCARLGF